MRSLAHAIVGASAPNVRPGPLPGFTSGASGDVVAFGCARSHAPIHDARTPPWHPEAHAVGCAGAPGGAVGASARRRGQLAAPTGWGPPEGGPAPLPGQLASGGLPKGNPRDPSPSGAQRPSAAGADFRGRRRKPPRSGGRSLLPRKGRRAALWGAPTGRRSQLPTPTRPLRHPAHPRSRQREPTRSYCSRDRRIAWRAYSGSGADLRLA